MEEERTELLNKKIEQYDRIKNRLGYIGGASIFTMGIFGFMQEKITYGTLVYGLLIVENLAYILISGHYVQNMNRKRDQAMKELHKYELGDKTKYKLKVKSYTKTHT